jgi:hypothetical protein
MNDDEPEDCERGERGGESTWEEGDCTWVEDEAREAGESSQGVQCTNEGICREIE